jgi:hypothetical protein
MICDDQRSATFAKSRYIVKYNNAPSDDNPPNPNRFNSQAKQPLTETTVPYLKNLECVCGSGLACHCNMAATVTFRGCSNPEQSSRDCSRLLVVVYVVLVLRSVARRGDDRGCVGWGRLGGGADHARAKTRKSNARNKHAFLQVILYYLHISYLLSLNHQIFLQWPPHLGVYGLSYLPGECRVCPTVPHHQ